MYIRGCRRVTLTSVTIRNSAAWTVHLLGCEDVLIQGIHILNDLRVPNCDGIDPNHCRNVRIANCFIPAKSRIGSSTSSRRRDNPDHCSLMQ